MEHEFRHPFIGEILNQIIDKGQRRVIRNNTARLFLTLIFGFQATDDGRGVGDGIYAIGVFEQEGRHQYRLWRCHPQFFANGVGLAPNDGGIHTPIAQQRQHFLRIGRGGAADKA